MRKAGILHVRRTGHDSTLSGRGARRGHGSQTHRKVFVRPIAHRGLHDPSKGRLENTAPAFRAAIEKGYGIECDLQAAEDGTPMVFHDPTLDRLVAASGPITAYAPSKLARFRYKGQNEKILTFVQLLDCGVAACRCWSRLKANPHTAHRLPGKDREGRARLRWPDRADVVQSQHCCELNVRAPKVPRGSVFGITNPHALWARRRKSRKPCPFAPVRTAARSISFFAVDVKLAAVTRDRAFAQCARPAAVACDVRPPAARDGVALGRRTDLRGI